MQPTIRSYDLAHLGHVELLTPNTQMIFEFVCEENNRCRGGQCVASEAQK